MRKPGRRDALELAAEVQSALIAGARDVEPVRGLTHSFYKYPARFSPAFVAAAIHAFTEPGDLVLDPYVGGGTTLVEALAAGRGAVGVDISTLAEFVSTVKATIFSASELEVLEHWSGRVAAVIHLHRPSIELSDYQALGYYKHLSHPSRWRLRKAIEQALEYAVALGTPRLESFARCVVLRVAQWALDGRRKQATVDDFRGHLREVALQMVQGARDLRIAANKSGRQPLTILRRSAAGIETDAAIASLGPPRLVVTSPPYPGVHVLYHRWQVDGRKEAPLPFMIANKLDGAGSSYYTMGDRKHPELATYFANIKATMSSVASLSDDRTTIVQMLAFSDVQWQLPRYLETMEEAGLTEVFLSSLAGEADGRLWRRVPGRRWYSDQRGSTPGSKEVVLIHRKATASRSPLRARPAAQLPTNPPEQAWSGQA